MTVVYNSPLYVDWATMGYADVIEKGCQKQVKQAGLRTRDLKIAVYNSLRVEDENLLVIIMQE